MKTLRLFGIALLTVLMNVSFSACGGSDEEDDNGGGGNTPLVSKRLAKVTTQEGSSTFSDEFTYDSNGRVVKVVNKKNGNNSGHIIYTYTDNLIVKKQYYTGSSSVSETQYELENGLIAKKSYGKYINYTYNNGYLATLTRSKGGVTRNFTWKDGNLQSLKSVDSESEESYEYTSYATPKDFIYLDFIDDVDGELAPFYGKSSKNLPSKRIEVSVNDVSSIGNPNATEKVTEVSSYDWTMKDGLPVKLIVTEEKQSGSSTMIVDFEWE